MAAGLFSFFTQFFNVFARSTHDVGLRRHRNDRVIFKSGFRLENVRVRTVNTAVKFIPVTIAARSASYRRPITLHYTHTHTHVLPCITSYRASRLISRAPETTLIIRRVGRCTRRGYEKNVSLLRAYRRQTGCRRTVIVRVFELCNR